MSRHAHALACAAVLCATPILAASTAALPAVGIAYEVNSTGDGGQVGNVEACNDGTGHCTLRAAIQASNNHAGVDAITFAIPTSDPNYDGTSWTITLNSALPNIAQGVNIIGPGANKLEIASGGAYRIFAVSTSGVVSISDCTIRNGQEPAADGGAIANTNAAGTLHLTGCALRNNSSGAGSNFGRGGAIANSGILTIDRCTFQDNSADIGGAIWNGNSLTINDSTLSSNSALPTGGAIFSNAGAVTISNSKFSGNSASGDSTTGGRGGAIWVGNGTMTMRSSVMTANFASDPANRSGPEGGGIAVGSAAVNVTGCLFAANSAQQSLPYVSDTIGRGGAIANVSGNVSVRNSTFCGNISSLGGGIYTSSNLTVASCTFNANQAGTYGGSSSQGGGIYGADGAVTTIKSTLIAGNTSGANDFGADVRGDFSSEGYNLIGKNEGAATSFAAGNPNAHNDIVGTSAAPIDPKVDPYGARDNGGAFGTVALLANSPAIDKGNTAGSGLSADGRGLGYARRVDSPGVQNASGGDGADIGAFEYGAYLPTVSRKVHGGSGTYDIDVSLGGADRVECRSGGATGDYQLILTFPAPVSVHGSPQAQAFGGVVGTGGTPNGGAVNVNGTLVTIPLTNVQNAFRSSITLFGVSDGTDTNDVTIPLRVLIGDANSDAAVNAGDATVTRNRSGQNANATTFRADYNVDGFINAGDATIARTRSGQSVR